MAREADYVPRHRRTTSEIPERRDDDSRRTLPLAVSDQHASLADRALARRLGRPATLDDIPEQELDRLAAAGSTGSGC